MPEGKLERGTTLACEQCRTEFVPKNRNGVPARFCSRRCLDANRNARRLQAVASLNHKKPRNRRRISKHAEHVSQTVFMALVPIAERAELLRQAAENLGITDQDRIAAALRRAEIPNYEECA